VTYVIAVAGHPGAGKTSLVKGLCASLDNACALYMDSYENMTRMPVEALARWIGNGADINAFDFPHLQADLQRLKRGEPIVDPASREAVLPGKYVLFETQFGRAHRATGAAVDFAVWIDTPLDVALARNLKAIASRALGREAPHELPGRLRWIEGYLENYLTTVRPLMAMQKAQVSAGADLVVNGEDALPELVRAARDEILRRLP
jgi:uridine kinase